MMVAIDKHGKRFLATTCTKRQSLFCPACKEPVILKTGQQKTAHFAHKNLQDCFGFSEKETIEHLQLKKYFFEWCRQFVTHPPVLEAYLPALRQRPDILCGDLAIEIQCSVLAYERMKERTKGYLSKNYRVWWILGSAFFKNDRLKTREKYFCMYNDTMGTHLWKIDWLEKRLYLFYHLAELFSGIVTYETISWPFFSESPVSLLEKQMENQNRQKVLTNVGCQKWLQKKLYYRQSKYVHLQKQFYLRKKHLLYLSPWMYAESRFFFIFKKKSSFIVFYLKKSSVNKQAETNNGSISIGSKKLNQIKQLGFIQWLIRKRFSDYFTRSVRRYS